MTEFHGILDEYYVMSIVPRPWGRLIP